MNFSISKEQAQLWDILLKITRAFRLEQDDLLHAWGLAGERYNPVYIEDIAFELSCMARKIQSWKRLPWPVRQVLGSKI